MSLVLVDADRSSLTVSWTEIPDVERYVLEYRRLSNSENGNENFETLSDTLTTNQVRKKNLHDQEGLGFIFRVEAVLKGSTAISQWVANAEPFHLIADDTMRMDAPRVSLTGKHETLLVAWNRADNTDTYELQMRENKGGSEWATIAPNFAGTEVYKKNLSSTNGYQFRVRPSTSSKIHPFSRPSEALVAIGISSGVQKIFHCLDDGTLIRNTGVSLPLASAVSGKEFILLYASAHWCPPCRRFTPVLAQWYSSLGVNRTVEVVFLSADHDKKGFHDYFKGMPWLAVAYDDDARNQLMTTIRVTGIPRLCVLDGKTGRIIEENAIGSNLDIGRWRRLAAAKG